MKIVSWIDIGTGRASIEIDGKKIPLGNSEDMREACHRISVAVSFCEGFTTEQLEATSLRELVDALTGMEAWGVDVLQAIVNGDRESAKRFSDYDPKITATRKALAAFKESD